MSWIDIVLGLVLLLGLYRGFSNGFFVELASLLGLALGIYAAIHFSDYAADYLTTQFSWDETTINLTAFAITFLIVLIAVSFIGRALSSVASVALLGGVNKLLGAAFGLLKTAFISSVVIMFINSAAGEINLINQETRETSQLLPLIEPLAPAIMPRILSEIEERELFKKKEQEREEERQEETSVPAS